MQQRVLDRRGEMQRVAQGPVAHLLEVGAHREARSSDPPADGAQIVVVDVSIAVPGKGRMAMRQKAWLPPSEHPMQSNH